MNVPCCSLRSFWHRHNIGSVVVQHFVNTFASQVTVRRGPNPLYVTHSQELFLLTP